MKLLKRYHRETEVIETTIEAEFDVLVNYFHNVDYLAEPGAYPVFDEIPEGEYSFKTMAANYYWIRED